jgi:hypothetical protein
MCLSDSLLGDQLIELNSEFRFGEITFGTVDQQLNACRIVLAGLLKGFDPLLKTGKEYIRVRRRNHPCFSLVHECLSLRPYARARQPPKWVTAIGCAKQRASQGDIPFPRPTCNDQAVFVKNPVKKHIVFCRVGAEFFINVPNAGILVVTVKFHEEALAMNNRFRTQ